MNWMIAFIHIWMSKECRYCLRWICQIDQQPMIDSITITMEILNGELALCAFHALHSSFFSFFQIFLATTTTQKKKIQSNTFKWLNDIGGGEKRRVFSSSALRIAFFHANNTPRVQKRVYSVVLFLLLFCGHIFFYIHVCLFRSLMCLRGQMHNDAVETLNVIRVKVHTFLFLFFK